MPSSAPDLGGDARAPRSASLHQLAHARLADTHARSRLAAREALQVAERRGLALACAEASAQRLEHVAQAHARVELLDEIVLAAVPALPRLSELTDATRPHTGTVLVDRAAVGHQHEPARRVRDLLALEHDRVQALPRHRVARLEIVAIERDAARPQLAVDALQHPPAQRVELAAQQTLGAMATEAQRAHCPGLCKFQILGEFQNFAICARVTRRMSSPRR